jgi:valyl-tRNA synthetase
LVTGIRRFKAEHGLAPRAPLTVTVLDPEGLAEGWWSEQLEALVNARPHFAGSAPFSTGFTRILAGTLEGYVELEGLIDVGAELARLARRLEAASSDLARTRGKLTNSSFLEKAPLDVVEKEQAKADELEALVEKLETQLNELGA